MQHNNGKFRSIASAKVNVERLTRIGETALQYEITSNDPGTYTAPYTRQIIFDFSPDPVYKYACHEGNYGMMNILSGHRTQERLTTKQTEEN